MVVKLADLPNQWRSVTDTDGTEVTKDFNIVVVRTRAALEMATNTKTQAQLWPGDNFACHSTDMPVDGDMP